VDILHLGDSYNNTSRVKQSDWIIITWIYKTRFGGQVKWINKNIILDNTNYAKDLVKWTIQTYKTTEFHKTNTTDDNTRWYNTSEQVNRNSYVDSMLIMRLCVKLYAILDEVISCDYCK